jgi:GNAT superfamily N-acetyltransferase
MSAREFPIPLKMVRRTLEAVPEFPLSPGFRLRAYQAGDEEIWRKIHLAADRFNEITPGLFAEQFGTDTALLGQRQIYLVEEPGQVIGTGTAWFNHGFQDQSFGRIHWVALLPERQGQGLARPLMTALCRRLRELGHERAYLSTSSARVVAIRLYQRFGFVPLIEDEQQRTAWRQLGFRG